MTDRPSTGLSGFCTPSWGMTAASPAAHERCDDLVRRHIMPNGCSCICHRQQRHRPVQDVDLLHDLDDVAAEFGVDL